MMRLILPILFLATFVPAYAAEPCTKAAPDCTEWVNLGTQARGLVYRTYALETKNDTITRALIMIHGANRDADNYFRTALAATFLANAFADTHRRGRRELRAWLLHGGHRRIQDAVAGDIA